MPVAERYATWFTYYSSGHVSVCMRRCVPVRMPWISIRLGHCSSRASVRLGMTCSASSTLVLV